MHLRRLHLNHGLIIPSGSIDAESASRLHLLPVQLFIQFFIDDGLRDLDSLRLRVELFDNVGDAAVVDESWSVVEVAKLTHSPSLLKLLSNFVIHGSLSFLQTFELVMSVPSRKHL